MNNQPEALRLAETLLNYELSQNYVDTTAEAAAELRRLHEVNQELMKAIANGLDLPFGNEIAWFEWRNSAEVALEQGATMKKLDLIIDALEISYTTEMSTSDRRLCNEALSAARELRALKPVGYKLKKPYTDIFTDRQVEDFELVNWTPLYALGESNEI